MANFAGFIRNRWVIVRRFYYIEKVYAVLLSIRQVDFCFGVSEIVCMNDFTAKRKQERSHYLGTLLLLVKSAILQRREYFYSEIEAVSEYAFCFKSVSVSVEAESIPCSSAGGMMFLAHLPDFSIKNPMVALQISVAVTSVYTATMGREVLCTRK